MTDPSAAAPHPIDRATGRAPRRRPWHALVVALFAVVPMLPSLRAAFVYDDTTIIRDNSWLRGWPALLHVWSEPYWPTTGPDALGLYRPVHVALLATVWNTSGGAAFAFHVYALLLTALASLAVWWLVRRATMESAALVAALWFATHPLHVEAVASVANSSELLVVGCTVALAERMMRTTSHGDVQQGWTAAAFAGILATAALLSKESGLFALPVAALTAWGWRTLDRPGWRAVLAANARGVVLGAIGIAAALIARRMVLGAAVSRTSIAAAGVDMPAPARVLTMLSLWPHIAGSIVWPSTLAPYYGPTIIPAHLTAPALASVAAAVAIATLVIAMAWRGERRPLVALAWIALTYFPASNLLVATGQLLADRTLYGATAGVALALAWGLDALPLVARRAAIAVGMFLIAHGVYTTARYSYTWTSHRALWTRLIAVEPGEHLGYKLLGMDARARGERERAVALLSRAGTMAPADRQIRFEYGQALYEAQRYAESATVLGGLLGGTDVRDEPGFVGLYLDAVGRSRGAQSVIDAATSLRRTKSAAVASLYAGLAFEQLGQRAAADSAYAAGLAASPGDSTLLLRRAAPERSAAPPPRAP